MGRQFIPGSQHFYGTFAAIAVPETVDWRKSANMRGGSAPIFTQK